MQPNDTGPVRPAFEEGSSCRPRWQAAGAVALGLVLLIVVLWALGRDRAVEETTVPTTLAAGSTTAASTTTTVPAAALDGIVIYVTDGCADCSLLESTLRGLAGEVPVWVRPADGTVSRVPTVVVQFGGEVSARWEGQVAVNSPEAIAASAGARWPTGTLPPTTTIPLVIVAAPIAAEDIFPCYPCPLVAVSAREVWAPKASPGADLIGHLEDGVWAFYRFDYRGYGGSEAPGLAVAPDGTMWAATSLGVFSFEGGVSTRRFDGPARAVAVDDDGTVWIGGMLEQGLWLARWDGESWVRVAPALWERPIVGGVVPMAVSSDGGVWISGWNMFETDLMHYDGATMEAVPVGDYPLDAVHVFAIEAAPNGDLWIGGWPYGDHLQVVVARFDGEEWTLYDWPFLDPSVSGGWLMFDLAVGPDGVVWFAFGGYASAGGLGSFDGTEWTAHIEGPPIWSVDIAPDGTVWYADEEGVHTLRGC
jgi:hypothetical protein